MSQTAARGFPGDDDYEEGTDYPVGADTRDYTEADALLGPSIPAASFPEIGTTVEGTVLDVGTQTQRDPDGNVQTWPDGSVRRQVVLTIQTDQKGVLSADDDGRRRLFVKGSTMPRAFREALGKAGVHGPRPGGHVVVTYYDDGVPVRKGLNPPKQFSVGYTKPTS